MSEGLTNGGLSRTYSSTWISIDTPCVAQNKRNTCLSMSYDRDWRGWEEGQVEPYETNLPSLLKTLHVLQPYLKDIVICGGWVPVLYRRYLKLPFRQPPLLTKDIDVVVPRRLSDEDRPTVDELLRQADYEVHLYGSDNPPVTKYKLSTPATEIEFLTPAVGRPTTAALTVQQGLTAQQLRYLSLLLDNVMELRVTDSLADMSVDLTVRVPIPGAFVYQKGLVLDRGVSRGKLAKDLYYIFEVLDCYAGSTEDNLLAQLDTVRRTGIPRWFTAFRNNLESYFIGDPSKGPVLVATQYAGPMPEQTFILYVQRTFEDFIGGLREMTSRGST